MASQENNMTQSPCHIPFLTCTTSWEQPTTHTEHEDTRGLCRASPTPHQLQHSGEWSWNSRGHENRRVGSTPGLGSVGELAQVAWVWVSCQADQLSLPLRPRSRALRGLHQHLLHLWTAHINIPGRIYTKLIRLNFLFMEWCKITNYWTPNKWKEWTNQMAAPHPNHEDRETWKK